MIASNVADIKPSDALTPSLGPMKAEHGLEAMDLMDEEEEEREHVKEEEDGMEEDDDLDFLI